MSVDIKYTEPVCYEIKLETDGTILAASVSLQDMVIRDIETADKIKTSFTWPDEM